MITNRSDRNLADHLLLIFAAIGGVTGGLGLWMTADLPSWGALPAIPMVYVGVPVSVVGALCWLFSRRRFDVLSLLALLLLALPWIVFRRLTS